MSTKRILLGVIAVVVCANIGVCFGATITVNWDGSGDYTTIQAAIDASDDEDEIEVAAGTYNEAIDFLGKSVRLYSIGGPGATIIDARELGSSVVSCISEEDANTILEGFTITGGNANSGGGMYNASSSPTVTNCIFSGNSADYGGGMYNYQSSPTLTNCTFSGNSTSRGGGMFNLSSSPTITGCTFSGNSAAEYGGGMRNESCSPTMINCTFSGNSAQYEGGGMYNYNSCPAVTNCTFSGNSAGWRGGGMYNYAGSNATVTNCILWGNTPDEIYNTTSTPIVTYSDVQGGYTGAGNINADPFFVTAAGGDLRLSSSASPCVDAGDNDAPGLATTDLAGNPRVADGDGDGTAVVDMGAFELQPGLVHNITQDIWYEIIQAAIDDADDGDEIEVGAGTYYEAINFKGMAVRLYSMGGPEVTTIDGTGNYHVVQCVSGEGPDSILEGFTITGGNANESYPDDHGGGMHNMFNSSPTVTNCTFSGNKAIFGGGMGNEDSNPILTNCTFSYNSADFGGGMHNIPFSSPTVTNCRFISNAASFNGGGMHNEADSSPTVTNCIFNENSADYGGGMHNMFNSSPTVTNCTFISNAASFNGGGMHNEMLSSPTVTNCTFSDNSADFGGGMHNIVGSSPTVTNCIFWNDTPNEISDMDFSAIVSYSNIQGGWEGDGNIDAYPLFVDAETGNLRLSDLSPCVDAGNNDAVPVGVTTDLDGNPRFADDAGIPDTGYGIAPIVDMGAYERQIDSVGPIYNITKGLYYLQIQAAIDGASNGDEIEVAPGMYTEAIDFLGKAIRLYSSGGPEVTTIDGTGNYHVVQCVSGEDANSILEGFTITGGNANGTWPDDCGGGIYNERSSPTVTNCTITENTAYAGGGMYNVVSSPTLTNCTFTGNTASYGGGMLNNSSSPIVTDCHFANNISTKYGGGMHNYSASNPTVINCGFSDNTASERGGGMYNDYSSPTVTNCTITENTAYDGGGMYNNGSSPTLTNCTFSINTVTHNGGGMNNGTSSNPELNRCTFIGNSSVTHGGGMNNVSNSIATVINCVFSGNSAGGYGGGMINSVDSSTTLTNCTFSGNMADNGGGMLNNDNSNPNVTNCIFWGDTPNEINNLNSSPTVTYSNVEGGYLGTGNINADPFFVDRNGGDFRLGFSSGCIDAGDNTALPSYVLKDLAGKLRYADDPSTDDTGNAGMTGRPVVDMGAYEFHGCGTISQNHMANPGFETGDATGWITNWGFSLEATTDLAYEGNYSGLTKDRTESWHGAWQSLLGLMDDGKTYRISGWVRLKDATSDSVRLTVAQTDSAGAQYYWIDNATAYGDRWVYLDGTFALDVVGELTDLYIYFEGPEPEVNFYVDSTSVTEVMGDMDHNGSVDLNDLSLFASYYGCDCSSEDCGGANFNDCDRTIDELDLAILCSNWLVGVEGS
jgi:hypothetical protein